MFIFEIFHSCVLLFFPPRNVYVQYCIDCKQLYIILFEEGGRVEYEIFVTMTISRGHILLVHDTLALAL